MPTYLTPAVAKATFVANPAPFAMRNVITVAYTKMPTFLAGGLGRMALVPGDGYTGYSAQGEEVPVYMVVDAADRPQADGFDAYWCPYENDQVKSVTVWHQGDAMFTARMDGCTFGIGAAAPDGAIRVAHVNMQKYDKRGNHSWMEAAQRNHAVRALGNNATLFEPKNYRNKPGEAARISSTTFGVRNPTTHRWGFYAQLVEASGLGGVTIRSVKKIN